jgi:hypothetical protein
MTPASVVPTYRFFKNGQQFDSLIGVAPRSLEGKVRNFSDY